MAVFKKDQPERNPRPKTGRPRINTYYRAESKSPQSPFVKEVPKRPTKKYLLGFLDLIILAILLVLVLYALALKSTPTVEANDLSYHPKSVYAQAAKAQFSRLNNRNKITFDETSVVQSLQKQFPEISAVEVELPFFSEQPVLHLTIAKPSFILNSNGSLLVVDSGGVAVGNQSDLGLKNLPIVNDQSGYIAKTGRQVMSAEAVAFINTLIAECRADKVPITSLTLPPAAQELQLRTADQSYYVRFYLGGDALAQAGQFLAARAHFNQTHQPPTQYLDVRVPGKIFYK